MAINLIVILCKRLNKETEDAAVDVGSQFVTISVLLPVRALLSTFILRVLSRYNDINED